MEYFKLNNGLDIPKLGLGCGGIYKKSRVFSKDSLGLFSVYLKTIPKFNLMYDSEACGYHEKLLGEAIKLSKHRNDIFLCTKVSNRQQSSGNIRDALTRSLQRLNTDYLDLYLIHWPQTNTYIETYLQMEELLKEGLVKAIGVCNFNRHHLEELRKYTSIIPAVNQFEIHPLFTQNDLVEYCLNNSIQPIAYTPIARNHDVLMKSLPIRTLAEKYNKSAQQIVIRWHIQRGICAIPKTSHYDRVIEYLGCFDFKLTEDEMNDISGLNDNVRLRYNPDKCDFSML